MKMEDIVENEMMRVKNEIKEKEKEFNEKEKQLLLKRLEIEEHSMNYKKFDRMLTIQEKEALKKDPADGVILGEISKKYLKVKGEAIDLDFELGNLKIDIDDLKRDWD